jgi:uncharacterized membrane protein
MATRGSIPPSEQARLHHMSQLPDAQPQGAWAGWVTFAATVLVLAGCMNGIQGFLALLDDGYFVARGSQLAVVSYDTWGAVLIAWGIILLVVGAALNARRGWARWLAIIAVMLNVIAQVGFFPAFPLLSLTMIALDVTILFALTAHWDEAEGGI